MASARLIAGRMVVSRGASIDLPAPGGTSKRTLWSERQHPLQLYIRPASDTLTNLKKAL
jgi:hypothetical protein